MFTTLAQLMRLSTATNFCLPPCTLATFLKRTTRWNVQVTCALCSPSVVAQKYGNEVHDVRWMIEASLEFINISVRLILSFSFSALFLSIVRMAFVCQSTCLLVCSSFVCRVCLSFYVSIVPYVSSCGCWICSSVTPCEIFSNHHARLLVCVSVHARFPALCSRLFGFCALTICVLHPFYICTNVQVTQWKISRFRVIVRSV